MFKLLAVASMSEKIKSGFMGGGGGKFPFGVPRKPPFTHSKSENLISLTKNYFSYLEERSQKLKKVRKGGMYSPLINPFPIKPNITRYAHYPSLTPAPFYMKDLL